jgi:hypothetical protein
VVPAPLEPDVDQPCGCAVTFLVVHPDERVRGRVLDAVPGLLLPLAVARPDHLGVWLAGARHPLGVLVVALDPARTPAVTLRRALPPEANVHLLSISDLQLDDADPAVDSHLPRRRLTRATLLRHLRAVGVLDPGCGTTVQERVLAVGASA